jgi:hypothetical protein
MLGYRNPTNLLGYDLQTGSATDLLLNTVMGGGDRMD